MSSITLKRSSVAGKVPLTTDLQLGELAINTYDGKLYLKQNQNGTETIVDVTAGGTVISQYVANVAVGTNLSVSGTPGAGWTPTITLTGAPNFANSVTSPIYYGSNAAFYVAPSANTLLFSLQVTNPIIANITGNAGTATALQTARTIALNGDVAGSAVFNGTADLSITTVIQPNSVALGTDTTGNYVAGITGGTDIAITGTAGEGWSPTVSVTSTLDSVTGRGATTNNAITVGDLTANNVTYNGTLTGSTGIVNIGSGQIYKDATGNIGIGTTTPAAAIHYAGGSGQNFMVVGTTNVITLKNGTSATANGGFQQMAMAGSEVALWTGTPSNGYPIERFRIKSTGYVGIGTSSPSSIVEVASNNSYLTLTQNATGSVFNGLQLKDSSAVIAGGLIFNQSTGEIRNNAASAYYQTIYSGGAERLRITTTGAVGINTASPATALDVAYTSGMARFGGSAGNNLVQVYSSGGTLGLWAGGDSKIYSSTYLQFLVGATTGTGYPTGGTAIMAATTSGISIGSGSITPSEKLSVYGTIGVNTNTVLSSEANTAATTASTTIASFDSTIYRSAKFVIQAYDTVASQYQVTELLVIHDGTTAYSTEYATILTTNTIAFFDVSLSAGRVNLNATGATTNSTQYKVSETLLKV